VGGRNQEAALAAARQIAGRDNIVFGTLATDGIDGPTDAAGAIVDGETVARGEALGLDVVRHLEEHDAYPYLEQAGDLLRCGPTGTNVGDLWVVLRP
jgi:hydroxypyruvate reductase